MNKILKSMIAIMASIAVLTTQADAGLIRVNVDQFNTPNNSKQTVFSSGNLSVERSLTLLSSSQFSSTTVSAGFGFDEFIVDYNVINGNWGDVFGTNSSGAAGSSFDGFAFNVALFGGATGTVDIEGGAVQIMLGGGPQALTAGINDFRNVALATDTSARFTFRETSGSGLLVLTGTQAIPEPTALLLVGSVLALGLGRRRR